MPFFHKIISSPVGKLKLIASEKHLCAVMFNAGKNGEWKKDSVAVENHPILDQASAQLAEYFSGKRQVFDVPLDPQGTEFRKRAWKQLCKIPYGKTVSYGEQARGMGDAKKARAIGQANGENPICIIIPCHRVIGANGALTGFGGGITVKKFLLELEKTVIAAQGKKK